MGQYKNFNGVQFRLAHSRFTKEDANKEARKLKKEGYKTRITHRNLSKTEKSKYPNHRSEYLIWFS